MITETKLTRRQQMVIPELKFTKKVTVDEEGTVFKLPRFVVEKPQEVERRRFYVVSTDIEARGHMGSCLGVALLTPQGEATGFRERIGTTILAREARRETCKDRVAERKRVREMRRARIERGAGDVPEEPGDKDDEQVAVRHASGGHIIENQHEKKRKRDIQVSGAVKASTRPCSTIREQRKARANDLWSRILRWAAQTRRPKEVNERGSEATID